MSQTLLNVFSGGRKVGCRLNMSPELHFPHYSGPVYGSSDYVATISGNIRICTLLMPTACLRSLENTLLEVETMVPIPLRSQLRRLTPVVALSSHPSSRDVRPARQFKSHISSPIIHSCDHILLKLLLATPFQDCVSVIVLMRASQRLLCGRAARDSLISKVIDYSKKHTRPSFLERHIRDFKDQEL